MQRYLFLGLGRTARNIAFSIAGILAAVLIYHLFWGKLFPYSPYALGFTRNELSNVIVYVQDHAEYSNYKIFDSFTFPVEEFHGLKFKEKPAIYIFKDEDSYLQRSITNARFFTCYNGNILISPEAIKEAEMGLIPLDIYIKHELSHSILFQNKGILTAYKYPKWLLEGIAVYSSGQMGLGFYPSSSEVCKLIAKGNFMPPEYFENGKENEVVLNVGFRKAFIYCQFACMVDYLITRYGKDKFLNYMKTLLYESDHNLVFASIYGISFEEYIQQFKNFAVSKIT